MSIETAIDNLLNTLRGLSTTYRSSAQNLIDDADSAAGAVRSPEVPRLEYDANRQYVGVERAPLPPGVPNVRALAVSVADELQTISGINDKFTSKVPTFSWPEFSYATVPKLRDFTDKPPTLKPLEIPYPDEALAPFTPPTLTAPTPVTVEALAMTPPNLTPLEVAELPDGAADLLTPYQEQLDTILADFSVWREWLRRQGTAAKELSGLIGARLREVIQGSEAALTDTWETQTYQQAQHEALVQRHAGLLELDTSPGSITGVPSGTREFARLSLELRTLQTLMQAAAKTATTRYQEEAQHLRWALQLAMKWSEALADLFADVQAWRLQGIQVALDGAQAALDAALKVLAYKEKELALRARYNDAQLRRLELSVKIERTKLEKLQVQVANNQLIATYNDHQADIDAAATTYVKSRLDLFDAQVTYLLADQEWQKLGYARFEAEVLAYQARVNAMKAEQAALTARIKGDLAKADTELAKAQVYTVTMQAQEANTRALALKSKVQADRMRQVLTEYNAGITAKLAWLRQLDSVVTVAVQALVKGLEAENKVAQIALARQEVEDQDTLTSAWQELRENQLESLRIVQGHSLAVAQAKATGQVIAQGSDIMGTLAKQAYAGLNAIGARESLEEA